MSSASLTTESQFPIGVNKENNKATVPHEQEDEILMRAIAMSLEVIETREERLPFITQSEQL